MCSIQPRHHDQNHAAAAVHHRQRKRLVLLKQWITGNLDVEVVSENIANTVMAQKHYSYSNASGNMLPEVPVHFDDDTPCSLTSSTAS
jgi:hypothetical protein